MRVVVFFRQQGGKTYLQSAHFIGLAAQIDPASFVLGHFVATSIYNREGCAAIGIAMSETAPCEGKTAMKIRDVDDDAPSHHAMMCVLRCRMTELLMMARTDHRPVSPFLMDCPESTKFALTACQISL